MAEKTIRPRGPYAKSAAKREEILQEALEVVAREGYGGASVRGIALAANLTHGGLLHYFGSKEELFTEILRKRDEIDQERVVHGKSMSLANEWDESIGLADVRAAYLEVIRYNSEVPGLLQVFSRLAVDASDPAHPAHDFFLARGAALRAMFAGAIGQAQEAGTVVATAEASMLARILQAVADGLQLQRMIEPDLDMSAIVAAVFDLLGTDSPAPVDG